MFIFKLDRQATIASALGIGSGTVLVFISLGYVVFQKNLKE